MMYTYHCYGKLQEHVEDSIQKEVNAVLQSALRVAAIVINSNATVLNGLSGELKGNCDVVVIFSLIYAKCTYTI